MGIKYAFSPAQSSLMCAEDCSSILCNEEGGGGDCEVEVGSDDSLIDVAPMLSEECIGSFLEREKEHWPADGYVEKVRDGGFEGSTRNAAIDWIWKVQSYYNFGPLSIYLSVNYLDRFLADYDFSESKVWMHQLLAVACLSLAVKMDETEVPSIVEMQIVGGGKFVFEARTVERMELLVLRTLKWRMQSVTPFTFISHYLHEFNERRPQTQAMMRRCAELIVRTLHGSEFLGFKPSEIAAATALSVISEAYTLDVDQTLSLQGTLSKEGVTRCYELFRDIAPIKKRTSSNLVVSMPQSPSGVLDAACLSFNSSQETPTAKRKKLSR